MVAVEIIFNIIITSIAALASTINLLLSGKCKSSCCSGFCSFEHEEDPDSSSDSSSGSTSDLENGLHTKTSRTTGD